MTDREFATDVVRRLRQSGYEALWAGGCVRDELLGQVPADYDVATSARPEQVSATFRKTIEVGASFGVVEVIGPRRLDGSFPKVQVATFRSDGAYLDGRRPESVRFSSPEEDAQRRDFTINGMFFDPLESCVIDYVGGQADLEARIVRAIGNPRDRFTEDKLRLMRAVRMAARFDFPIEEQTAAAIREMASQLMVVSAERIAEELRKMFVHPNRVRVLRDLEMLGLLKHIVPEIPSGPGWLHALKIIELLESPRWPSAEPVSFPLAFAALLHTVGPRTAAAICRRLKLANTETTRIEWLVEKQQYLCDAPSMRPSQLKPILVHPGIGELLALHRALASASGQSVAHVDFCEKMLRETPYEQLDPKPLLTGDDLLTMGWKSGPRFKTVLDAIRDAQLDGTIATKEEAIDLANRETRKTQPFRFRSTKMFDLPAVQAAIRSQGFDGWLLYDFRGTNVLAQRIAGLAEKKLSRRWFYFVPATGEPRKLVHAIEPASLDALPGKQKTVYRRWQELEAGVGALLTGTKRIAMEYSPRNGNPYIGRVDAGTIELVRSFGVAVESSGDLVQEFEATWDDEQEASHFAAEKVTDSAYSVAWKFIADRIKAGSPVTELDVQKRIMDHFAEHYCTTYSPPIVGVGPHSGDPHYEPTPATNSPIRAGDFVLIDLWAKLDKPRAVYSDLTRVGFVGRDVPEKYTKIFNIVTAARDAGIDCIRQAFAARRPLTGAEVDDATRAVIEKAGYGDQFTHRTGHNIGQEVHGNGAHIDGLETRDDRRIMPRTCFSIEPGIYLPEFGVRSEVDVYIDRNSKVHVTGGQLQTEIVPIV